MAEKTDQAVKYKVELPEEPPGPFEFLMSQKEFNALTLAIFFVVLVSITFALYQIFTGHFTQPRPQAHRSMHLAFALILTFMIFPLGRKSCQEKMNWLFLVDLLLIVLVIAIECWIVWDLDAFLDKEGMLTRPDRIITMIYIAIILEATRRSVGWPLVLVCLFFIFHAFYAPYFPGVLNGPATPVDWFVEAQMIQSYGIFSIPIAVVSAYVALFIIFSVVLSETGAGKFFIDMAVALMGWQAGGPAKTAVVASSTFGTISGSVVANVVGTGSVTIPLMKGIGYPRTFAAAVEACASTGGQLMPPVMGAVAFVMAEFMGIPYIKVAAAAAIPAVLYYFSLFVQVHLEAKKLGLVGLPRDQLPKIWPVLKGGVHLLIPLFIIVWILVKGMTPMKAGFWGLVSVFLLAFLKKSSRPNPYSFFKMMERAGRILAPVSVACASAGIIIGCVFASGVGLRFSSFIIEISRGYMLPALFLTMIACIILGMGLTTTAVYVTVAALIIPVLIKMGVVKIAAHMFALYYGVISMITPPVAIGAYAAAGVADANPMRTGFVAWRLGIAGFIVPFMFVYAPEILLEGSWIRTVSTSITALIGIFCLASSVEGWLFTKENVIQRLLLSIAAITLIKPGLLTDSAGIGLLLLVIAWQKMQVRSMKS
ncbi:MAG: TRAP transporter permease [Deltaproteobacteria bacterium]|nr:TRAP transporter permease [Deltaproteobacteria bacterium]MBW2306965.1 TRAP transporter permease [Deltaproteobacteria bacterium]